MMSMNIALKTLVFLTFIHREDVANARGNIPSTGPTSANRILLGFFVSLCSSQLGLFSPLLLSHNMPHLHGCDMLLATSVDGTAVLLEFLQKIWLSHQVLRPRISPMRAYLRRHKPLTCFDSLPKATTAPEQHIK